MREPISYPLPPWFSDEEKESEESKFVDSFKDFTFGVSKSHLNNLHQHGRGRQPIVEMSTIFRLAAPMHDSGFNG